MRPQLHQWALALLLALGVHGAIAAAWLQSRVEINAADAAGVGGVDFSIGLAGSYVDNLPTPPAPEPVVERTPEPEPVKAPPEVKQPEPVKKKIAKEKPKPVKPQAQKPILQQPLAVAEAVRPQLPPAPVQSTENNAPPKPQAAVAQRATGTGQTAATGGSVVAKRSYYSEIAALIARNKRYPRAARRDGVVGVVVVSFGISGSGQLVNPEVKTSSGDSRLDQAAIEMLQRTTPFPRPPAALGDLVQLSLPVEFSLQR